MIDNAPEEISGWVNVYTGNFRTWLSDVYHSREAAEEGYKGMEELGRAACIHIKFTVGEGLE